MNASTIITAAKEWQPVIEWLIGIIVTVIGPLWYKNAQDEKSREKFRSVVKGSYFVVAGLRRVAPSESNAQLKADIEKVMQLADEELKISRGKGMTTKESELARRKILAMHTNPQFPDLADGDVEEIIDELSVKPEIPTHTVTEKKEPPTE